MAWAGIPFGSLVAGVAVAGIGLRAALLSGGAVYGVTTLLPFVFPIWREMDRPQRSSCEQRILEVPVRGA